MTGPTGTILLGALSAAGFTAAALIPQGPADPVPWKDLAGGGAAVLLLAALWMFLRFLRDERQERTAERTKDREHAQQLATTYTSSTTQLMTDFREESQLARREMLELVRDLKR